MMKKRFISLLFDFIFSFCFLTFICYADTINFDVSVDKEKVALGEIIQLNFTFYGTQNVPVPKIDKIENFNINYVGPSTVISIINGKVTTSITHIFNLLPLKTGTFTIGPFSVEIEGKTYTSKPITIEVLPSSPTPPSFKKKDEDVFSSEELKDKIFLILDLDKKKLYLNEMSPLTIRLYVSGLNVQDIQFPILQTEDFVIEKFEQPRQYRQQIGGIIYDVVEFKTNLLPVKTGKFLLGPAKLRCSLLVSKRSPFSNRKFGSIFDEDFFEDFFSRYQSYPIEVSSPQLPIEVIPLPEEGKPDDFDGAVGDFTLDVSALPLQVKVGDPITLKMVVKGEGNFGSVKAPKISSNLGFKVYEPQIKEGNNEKIFEQVIIPQSKDLKFIPQINFTFFNPKTSEYKTLSQPPIPITVIPEDNTLQKIEEEYPKPKLTEEKLGKDIVYLKNSLGKLKKKDAYLYNNFYFLAFNILYFLIFIASLIFYFRYKKINFDSRYSRQISASKMAKKSLKHIEKLLKEEKTTKFFDTVFKTLKQYLADKFNLPTAGITAETIKDLAKDKNILNDILEKIEKVFSDCDSARYGFRKFSKEELKEIFDNLKAIIEYLERQKL